MIRSITLPGGVTLQYAQHGQATGIPVLFLHGVTDSWRSFEPLFDHLPPELRAIAITQRGHGDSDKPEEGYDFVRMAADVRECMDVLDLAKAVVVGHSMGASVAQRFAIDYPDRLVGLVLMGAFRTIHGNAGVQAFWDSSLSSLADPVAEPFARDFPVSTLARPVPDELLDVVVAESVKVPARVWRALFRSFLETADFSRELSKVTVPTLIVWGDRDTYTPLADQQALVAAMARARLVVYAGAGHTFHWEEPRRFAEDLVAFLYERG